MLSPNSDAAQHRPTCRWMLQKGKEAEARAALRKVANYSLEQEQEQVIKRPSNPPGSLPTESTRHALLATRL